MIHVLFVASLAKPMKIPTRVLGRNLFVVSLRVFNTYTTQPNTRKDYHLLEEDHHLISIGMVGNPVGSPFECSVSYHTNADKVMILL